MYLKGLKILGDDVSKLGKSVLLDLFVLFQRLLDASPQNDHNLQQTGHNRFFQLHRFSLMRSTSRFDITR